MGRTITEAPEARQVLRALLEKAQRAVFFGGAGVSTESGIPDFRSAQGIYSQDSGMKYSPETIISHSFYESHPKEFWRFYRDKLIYPDARPNACHRKLAELEWAGHLAAVVTQNIDGLHQSAGSSCVLELHGSVHRNHCLRCGQAYTLAETMAFCDAAADGVPLCPVCQGPVKPDVVLYEEPLDGATMTRAMQVISQADVLVIAGTSLAVWPAAGFIDYFSGDSLVVCNLTASPADGRADLIVRSPVGASFDW